MAFFAGLLLFIPFYGNAQKDLKPEVSLEKVSEIYKRYDNLEKPGIAFGIVSNGKIVHTKGFGLANLEYNIPITAETKFYIGKISNQFTVLGILLLESKGKLSLNDDVRKHLPELPKFGNKISIIDLIHHTSGLRDIAVSKALVGWNGDDDLSLSQAIQFVGNQKQLNNIPNKEYQMNHSAFLLLEKIIASAAEDSFTSFIEKNIFQPLQMTNTIFDTDADKVIKNIAFGYFPNGDTYRKGTVNQFEMNNTNVYSTVGDICKWEQNFLSSNPKVGTVAMFKKMDTPVSVDGKQMVVQNNTMYFGQHQYWNYSGTRKMTNITLTGGYSCKIVRYPDYNFSAVVMGNDGVYNGGFATVTSKLYVENYFTSTPGDLVKVDGIKLDTETLESFTGDYWEPNQLYNRNISLKNDTLMYGRGNGYDSPIIPIGKNKFQMITYTNVFITFENRNNKKVMLVQAEGEGSFEHLSYNKDASWTKNLTAFTGEFYSNELKTSYNFSIKNNKLVASNLRLGEIEFNPILKDSFTGNRHYFNQIAFERKNNTEVKGFYLSTYTGDKIWFQKTTNKLAKNTKLN